jgi:hypothetical protein
MMASGARPPHVSTTKELGVVRVAMVAYLARLSSCFILAA